MSLKDTWNDLQDTTNGIDGDDVTAAPINLLAHSVIEAENNIENIRDDIESIDARTSVNEQNISAIADEVVETEENISGLDARIASNESNISQNKADITSLESRVDTIAQDVDANKADIDANTADIHTNKENINANSDEISKLKELVIKTYASGVDFNITDAAQMPLESLNIYGKTNQVHTTGKNLFAFAETITTAAVGITMTTSVGSSQFTVSGTPTNIFAREVLSCELPAGTYTMSMYGLVGVDDYVYLKNKNTNTISVGTLKNGKSKSFTITETTSFAVAPVIRNTNPYAYDNTPVYIQIEQGDTATDYEPYSNGVASPSPEYPQPMETIGLSGNITINVDEQTLDVETPNGLPGIPASSNGNYTDENGRQWVCDEIDFEKDAYIQRIAEITIPEFEYVGLITNNSGDEIYVGAVLISEITDVQAALCTVAKYSRDSGSNTINSNEFILVNDVDGTYIEIVAFAESEDEFRNKFEGEKMLLAFYEPIETHTLSDEQVSLYKSIYTNKPITHIFNDANAHVKVGYVADTKTYIDNKINTLIAAIITE